MAILKELKVKKDLKVTGNIYISTKGTVKQAGQVVKQGASS